MLRAEIVEEYLKVLDLDGDEPNFELLGAIVKRHVAMFAFSSVNCLLGEELLLDIEALYHRIVVRRRGGYCFEQNGLLYDILGELGFSPQLYLARVIYNQDHHPGLTHRISVVQNKGLQYVVDVGFGPLGPRVPVLMSESETPDGDRVFRVSELNPGEFHMQVFKDGEFFSLYRFELARYGQADCEVGHFYSHRHPNASFVNHLVVSRILVDETRSLRDLEYWVIRCSDKTSTSIVTSTQLWEVLVNDLGVQVTEAEASRLFERLET